MCTDGGLPDLPYDYAALEPYISGEIMELHHDKHHATYVKGINTATEALAEGSVLTWDMLGQRPYVIQHFDHQGNVPICMVPLLMLDMWEHAYYLQYKNDKATFVKQWWNIVNWTDVQDRLAKAKAQTPGLIAP